MVDRIWPEGHFRTGDAAKPQPLRLRDLRAAQRAPLSSLLKHFVFFTPALIYLYGSFRHRHLHDLFFELGRELPLYKINCSRPLVRCHPQHPTAWDQLLWACKRRDWEELSGFILSMAQYDAAARKLERYGQQELVLADLKGPGSFPLQAFGYNGNLCLIAFWSEPGKLPEVRKFRPRPDLVQYEEDLHREQLTSALTGQDPPTQQAA